MICPGVSSAKPPPLSNGSKRKTHYFNPRMIIPSRIGATHPWQIRVVEERHRGNRVGPIACPDSISRPGRSTGAVPDHYDLPRRCASYFNPSRAEDPSFPGRQSRTSGARCARRAPTSSRIRPRRDRTRVQPRVWRCAAVYILSSQPVSVNFGIGVGHVSVGSRVLPSGAKLSEARYRK